MSTAKTDPVRLSALQQVEDAAVACTFAAAALEEDVKRARAAGVTWQQIGDVLGITRQAAHERFTK